MFDVSEASGSYNMSQMQGWKLKYDQFKQPLKKFTLLAVTILLIRRTSGLDLFVGLQALLHVTFPTFNLWSIGLVD